jgi:hypothetical protein
MSKMQTEQLIVTLAGELKPVRRLPRPSLRALTWLALVAVVAFGVILGGANLAQAAERMSDPRVAIECAGAGLTGLTAIFAAFELSVPGASPRWGWLPVAPALVWLSTSTLGCLQHGYALAAPPGALAEGLRCFSFIAAASIPLALSLFWMLRRARPITPLPVAALGALGVAATAAFVLEFFHPFDVTIIDLALNFAVLALVMAVLTALRRPLLAAH